MTARNLAHPHRPAPPAADPRFAARTAARQSLARTKVARDTARVVGLADELLTAVNAFLSAHSPDAAAPLVERVRGRLEPLGAEELEIFDYPGCFADFRDSAEALRWTLERVLVFAEGNLPGCDR